MRDAHPAAHPFNEQPSTKASFAMKFLLFIIVILIAIGAYWNFGPISPSDAPYWAKLNSVVPEQYRKAEKPAPAPAQ
jgi:hypothetical protein